MPRGARTTLAVLTTALLLTACSGESATVTTDEQARQAIVDTFRDSWSMQARVEIDVSDEQVDAIISLAEEAGELPADEAPMVSTSIRGMVGAMRDQAERSTTLVSHAGDGSVRLVATQDDQSYMDLRVDARELLAADTLTPDVSVFAQFDLDTYVQSMKDMAAAMAPEGPDGDLLEQQMAAFPGTEELQRQVTAVMPAGPVREVVVGLLDGDMVGVTGTLDLGRFGATQDDLDEFNADLDEFRSEADEVDVGGLVDAAVSIRDLGPEGDATTGVVDVHPRAAVEAVIDAVATLDPDADPARDFRDEFGIEPADLPEAIPGIAHVTFDGDGRLVGVTVPVIDIVREVVTVVDDHTDVPPVVTEALAELEGARYDMVMTLTDHGAVETVVDVDAATVTWTQVADLVERLTGGPAA